MVTAILREDSNINACRNEEGDKKEEVRWIIKYI